MSFSFGSKLGNFTYFVKKYTKNAQSQIYADTVIILSITVDT